MSKAKVCGSGLWYIRIIAAIGAVLIIFAIAAACINGAAFDQSFYREEYKILDTAAYVGVSDTALGQATNTLLDYLQDNIDSLDLAMENGDEYYSKREKDHMVDVKNLYQSAMQFMIAGFCIGGGLIAVCFIWKRKAAVSPVLQSWFWAAIGVLAFFACIGIWAAVDFNQFWISFHRLFFSNDLWMLDPETSRMIRMFQEEFFAALVARILVCFLAITVGSAAAAGIGYRRIKKHERH